MKKTWMNFFTSLFVLLFAGLWIAGGVAEARSKGMKKREHHRHHSSSNVAVGDVVAVASGGFHTIELKTDGTVWAWGSNEFGQLGDGTTIDSPAPIQVSGLTDVTAITGGSSHTLALKTDGMVWAWGYNAAGQLGDGTSIDSPAPIQVSDLTDVAAIAAGNIDTIALKTDGTVWVWGYNPNGILGVETTEECRFGSMDWTCAPTPVQVSGLTDVTAIASGENHFIALKSDGTVWTWGSNAYGQLGRTEDNLYNYHIPTQVLTDVIAIAAGSTHTIVLKTDGTVWAWGSNEYGQLGNGTRILRTPTPVQVSGLTNVTAIAGGGNVGWLASGHTIALKADGTVWAWGDNNSGQLGVTTTEICEIYVGIGRTVGSSYSLFCSTTPVQVNTLTDITAIAAGQFHTLALKTYGTVWTWGDNKYGQLGAITTGPCGYDDDYFDCSPTPVPVRSKVTATFNVSGTVSGLTGTLVLQNNGGDDLIIMENGPFTFATELEDLALYDIEILTQPDGQTCEIISSNSERINATDITDISIICPYPFTEAVDIAAGEYHSIALKTDGTVWAWGNNGAGQLGVKTVEKCAGLYCSSTPVEVSILTDVVAVTAGDSHSIALKGDGTVWAWGENWSGQLGDGTRTSSTTPIQVNDFTDIVAVAAGSTNTFALKTDGTVWAWGYNGNGQLGNGTTGRSSTPVQVSELAEVDAIAAGWSHTLALKTDGTVWAWGYNGNGQLGVITTETCNDSRPCSSIPLQVSGLTDVAVITSGDLHSIALKDEGTVWAWGSNRYGQLGDGTTIDSPAPIQINGLTDVTAIVAGHSRSFAIKTDGSIWAWGYNGNGQLGDGTYLDSSTPVRISSSITDVAAIAAGAFHTLALKADGTLWVWGYNGNGQLADATTTDSTTPVQVLITP